MRPVDEQVAILMQGTTYGDEETRQFMERELRARLTEAVATKEAIACLLWL